MASTKARLSALLGHLRQSSSSEDAGQFVHSFNRHSLSPTFFLHRAALIEPNVGCSLDLGLYHD